MVMAGSDTVAATLIYIMLSLSTHPRVVKALQVEIDAYTTMPEAAFDSVSLTKLQYLDAVINETLRLYPPVPSGVQRLTPPEGLRIGDTHIPGDTIVQIPTHTIHRGMRDDG